MKYFSTFSGIGGFELGIQNAYDNRPNIRNRNTDLQEHLPDTEVEQGRVTCVGYSELDKYAIETYEKHFNHKNYGDITKINEKELPDFDLLVGGFPCQSFSIAGNRGGFDDTRGTLFFDLVRIIREKQPRNFIFENVKGLLSHDKGDTFTTIITTLDELGYDVEWQVLNSKNFGVPQNRERVYIVGHLRGESRPKVFPILGASSASIRQHGNIDQHKRDRVNPNTGRIYDTEGISPTLSCMQGGGLEPKILKDSSIRKLTPTECERLQGFPDGWTEGVSDSQRYKQCGNAVTTNVVQEIISKLYNHDK